MLDLAIVIVNYNTREVLDDCLRSVRASSEPIACKVILVDNGSCDGSVDMVREAYPWVRTIACERNGGYAWANNIGLRAAGFGQGKSLADLPRYALLLNPDTVLPPSALTTLIAFMDAHPDIGVVGPKLVRRDGSLDRACRRGFPTPAVSFYHFSGLAKLFPHSPRFARYNMTFLDPDQQADVDAVVGAFMLIRAEALEQAGLLDEAFFMYGEDLDLCYRCKARGWRVVYNPAVTVLHIKGAASRKASRQAIAAFYDAMKIFYDKHYRAQTCFLVNWGIDLGVGLLRRYALLCDRLRPAGRKRVASA
ncbi:MAG: glycosyltransferase family 2 protein [Chloroflexi bacterium]|nr:glycosyltransferase family 2 protein [Chloroflexota bacterium]